MRKILSYIFCFIIFSCSKDTEPEIPPPAPIVKYTLTVKAGEGGTVSSTGGQYENGTSVTITATANTGYEFEKWSDGNTDNPRTIIVNSNITVEAQFILECENEIVESKDLQKTSYELFDFVYPLDKDDNPVWEMIHTIAFYGATGIYFDYNNDGFMDVVGYENNYDNHVNMPDGYTGYERKQPIRFYLGTCDGNFIEDEKNDKKYLGLVHGRKLLLGDFNKDKLVDFFFIGHGYDKNPFPGEFPKVLISDGEGGFVETEYSNQVSFFHGGSSGDFDNDGDLDVFLIEAGGGKSAIYENNNGNLTPNLDLINQSLMSGMYNTEFFDINSDGYLDIIAGGHDWLNSADYDNTPIIIYGDGNDFIDNSVVRLPESTKSEQGVVTDFEFYDISGNGEYEIVISRTGDNSRDNTNFYKNWSIQILELQSGKYIDSTDKYIDISEGDGNWIIWVKIIEENGDIIMHNDKYPQQEYYKKWKLSGSKFLKIN